VDLERFELSTSSMPWKRAPNCATGPRKTGLLDNNTGPVADRPLSITVALRRGGASEADEREHHHALTGSTFILE
jgi:hypothetical protein